MLAIGAILFCASVVHADDVEPALPAPPLALSVTPGTGGGPWKLKVENTGDVPIRLTADPRLLVLEVTPPAGFVDPTAKKRAQQGSAKAEEPKTVRCILPDDARPANDEGRDLVVPAKRSWSVSFDPLLYCFGTKERAVLVTGAVVNAHFGWPAPPPKPGAAAAAAAARARAKAPPSPATSAPPFVAAPVGAAVGKVAAAKNLHATTVTLAESVNAGPPASAQSSASSSSLGVTMPEALDVLRGTEISATVSVANEGDKATVVLLRSETLKLSVAGPAGTVACGSLRTVSAPIRELYATLGVKGRMSLSILLTSICPRDTFDQPGLYRVTPIFDMTNASARSIGLKTWDGMVTGRSPMLMRVRAARRPSTEPSRPSLD